MRARDQARLARSQELEPLKNAKAAVLLIGTNNLQCAQPPAATATRAPPLPTPAAPASGPFTLPTAPRSPDGMLANETAAGVAAAAALIRRELPAARLVVTLVLPRSTSTLPTKLPGAPSAERARQVDALNELVSAALAGAERTSVVDCSDRFLVGSPSHSPVSPAPTLPPRFDRRRDATTGSATLSASTPGRRTRPAVSAWTSCRTDCTPPRRAAAGSEIGRAHV